MNESDNIYAPPYEIIDGCLYYRKISKQGEAYIRLCNFAPRIVSEITVDDGTELTRRYLVSGTDEDGRTLPEVEVAAGELERMEWMLNRWDASLDIEVVSQVEKHIRHAMKSTAKYAEKKSVFAHTGWKVIDGTWEYLMPGGKHDVRLYGKQQSYFLTPSENTDCSPLVSLLRGECLPMEIACPCLALVFLSPLNEFLRQVGHEPKFILTLLGRTGSMKSTVAALMLSFFGSFSATDLPMSFRDTANSIIHNAFALKDVLTCVDDYHPCSRRESENMKAIMQTLARGYDLFFDATQRAVKKFCDDQGEGFTISTKALGKALADEGFINTDGGENTHSKKIGGKSRRVLMLRKDKVRALTGE